MWKSAQLISKQLQQCKSLLSRPARSSSFKTAAGSLLLLGGTAFAGYEWARNHHHTTIMNRSIVLADTPLQFAQPNTKVKPFPVDLDSDGEKFNLLGLGVRSVSFLSFHVYAVGIYIAETHRAKAKQILADYGKGPEEIEKSLLDPVTSQEAISKLLNGHISLLLRIVPVRNTDFGHLRDGFVRTIMHQPRFKTEGNTESFGEGIGELKRAYGRKLSVKKDSILHLIRKRNGTMALKLFTGDPDFVASSSCEQLGEVTMPLVSELLFLQYLSGVVVSSEEARRNAIHSLANL